MEDEEQWFGPGETARRLGVSTKALRVYERELLVTPRRTESGWRLYGPAHFARLHQIIVLRHFGLSLEAIKKLVVGRLQLREVLQLQRESLQRQHDDIVRAISLVERAQSRLDDGRDLSSDDLSILTRETVMQPTGDRNTFVSRLEAMIAEEDSTGRSTQAFEIMKSDFASHVDDAKKAELKALIAEAAELQATGDPNSEAAKDLIRRFESHAAGIRRPAQAAPVLDAFAKTVAAAQRNSESLPFDPAVIAFLAKVKRGMRERGELA